MKLSVIIPAHNEEGHLRKTVENIKKSLIENNIEYEILIVNDNSSDNTLEIGKSLHREDPNTRIITNTGKNGYGFAIVKGLNNFNGDAVVLTMADGSDNPDDIVKYYTRLQEGFDCVFGTRFTKGANVVDYPIPKLILNRIGNIFIKTLFRLKYNDVTNGFKCYKREVIEGIKPILSHHFNLTVEMPLKAIVRGYSYSIVSTDWFNREKGISKWKIKETGSRYLFIILYVLLEKYLSRGDYIKKVGT